MTRPSKRAPARSDLASQRVAAYARVSTEDQAERDTVAAQRDFLARYVDLHSLDLADVYVDDGISGTTPLADRPEGQRLLADAAAGRFATVLVYRLDRLGRNLRALLDAHDQLDAAGVSIRSCTEPFDTSTPIGQFLFQLLGSLAELEKSTITDRLTLGRDRVARAGAWTSGCLAFGLDVDREGRMVPSARVLPHGATEAETVRELYQRIAAGATLHAECKRLEALGVPSITRWPNRPDRIAPRWWPSRLHGIITNPIYKGAYVLASRNGPVEVPVPAIVDDTLWQAAQRAMTANRDLSRAPEARAYLLRGLVRCRTILDDGTVCGRTYTGAPGGQGGSRLYYHCSGAREAHPPPDRPRCIGRSMPVAMLEAGVWADVRAFVLNPGPPLSQARAALDRRTDQSDRSTERARLTAAIVERAAERERAQTLFRRGLADLDETERAITACDAELSQLRDLLAGLDAETAADQAIDRHLSEAELLIGSLVPLVAAGDAGDQEAQRRVLDLLVREISVTTELIGRTKRRQKRDQKRVRAVVHYRFSPIGAGERTVPMLVSIPSGSADWKLPNLGVLSIDRELMLV